jgi:hypothetical protein
VLSHWIGIRELKWFAHQPIEGVESSLPLSLFCVVLASGFARFADFVLYVITEEPNGFIEAIGHIIIIYVKYFTRCFVPLF